MAARENQGLQIALIIFVMLTIVLIVTTFLFFRNFQEAQEKIKGLTSENSKAQEAARGAIDESTKLKGLVDTKLEKIEAVEEAAKKDFTAHGKGLAEADQNYRNLVGHLAKELAGANTRITEITASEKALTDKIAADEAATKEAIAKYTATIATTSKDLEDERKKFEEFRQQIGGTKEELAKRFDQKRSEFDDLTKKSGEQITLLTGEVTRLTKLLQAINEEKTRSTASSEVSDGKISWVNQRSRNVWLNLGSDDGLRRQTTFSVVGGEESNPASAKSKGKIEVINLLGPHMAEARIVEDDLSDPLMPGDKVFSPTWEPGRAEHFGLAGFMDIDGDGESDRQRIHDLIRLGGGVVDAEVTDDGKVSGKLSINTKYLIYGDEPHGEAAVTAYGEMKSEAQTLGVHLTKVNDFLDYMGYKPEDRTVQLGKKSKSSDFKARMPDVQRTSHGLTAPRDLRRVPKISKP